MGCTSEKATPTPTVHPASHAQRRIYTCRRACVALVSLALLSASCAATESNSGAVFFEEVSRRSGLDYVQFRPYECFDPIPCGPLYMTGGAAAGDFDLDGSVDLVVTRVNAYPILYRNRGDGTFDDVTAGSGLEIEAAKRGNGAAFADVDADGCLDIVMTVVYWYRNLLFMGDCQGHFREEGERRGIGTAKPQPSVYGFGIAAGDFDRDGWLDLFLGEWRFDLAFPEAPNEARLLRNRGAAAPGHFEDVTDVRVRLVKKPGLLQGSFWWSPVFADVDRDGCQDLVLVGDFETSKLFWNDCEGRFVEAPPTAGFGTDENGMGVAIGDYDGDGLPDIFVSSIFQTSQCEVAHNEEEICAHWGISGNRLYKNRGDRTFEDTTDASGVRNGRWGWGAAFLDFDNDSHLDLAQTAGQFFPYPDFRADNFFDDPSFLWVSDGTGKFHDMTKEAGLDAVRRGKALLVVDADSDGMPDIFVVQNSARPVLLRNRLWEAFHRGETERRPGKWLKLQLKGAGPLGDATNPDGVGAQVVVTPRGGRPMFKERLGGTAFLGQGEPLLHFGLGDSDRAVVEVFWPVSGCRHAIEALAETVLVIEESECLAIRR